MEEHVVIALDKYQKFIEYEKLVTGLSPEENFVVFCFSQYRATKISLHKGSEVEKELMLKVEELSGNLYEAENLRGDVQVQLTALKQKWWYKLSA